MSSRVVTASIRIATISVVTGALLLPSVTAGAVPALPATHGATHRTIIVLRGGAASASVGARRAAATQAQQPIVAELRQHGVHVLGTTDVLNAVIADLTPAQSAALSTDSRVADVLPDSGIPGPAQPASPPTAGGSSTPSPAVAAPCGTAAHPELDPEALQNINAQGAFSSNVYGSGVTVAFLAGGMDTANADMQRNPQFASTGSPSGSPVITDYSDFSGDGTAAPAGDAGVESLGDASSIAAQANQEYDLSQFVNQTHPLPAGCDIRIQGAAPGASLEALKIFGERNGTSSGLIQAIQHAVDTGAKVINESFGSNPFPDTSLDLTRMANDAAVAAGVTVVMSSGDSGLTNTIGSPASDPNVISVGATTTFRTYAQETFGGINNPAWTGGYVDNNISSLSSGGITQGGRTVDLVAPGDLNWALCSTDTAVIDQGLCNNFRSPSVPSPIQAFGGTSESAPLTSGAAADVIEAYARTHHGNSPSPALVKQILTSTAADIYAPAEQQGAGLLNVGAAVGLAESIGTTSAVGGALISPNQINVTAPPNTTSSQAITLTNTSTSPMSVSLSTRALTQRLHTTGGTFCLQPAVPRPSGGCKANTGVFPIWSGVPEVYQLEHFTVPGAPSKQPTRLKFSADYAFTGQGSLLHVALIDPAGRYAGYSLPQGLGDFAEIEVADPQPGRWTAVFFTAEDNPGAGLTGTSGPVQWQASLWQYAPADPVTPSPLFIAPGGSATAHLLIRTPATSGDTSESLVMSGPNVRTTIPVILRTLVPVASNGGTFTGVITGGNGRGGLPAAENTYAFDVSGSPANLGVSVAMADNPSGPILLGDELIGYLIDPSGQAVGYSSNYTLDAQGNPIATRGLTVDQAQPTPGRWTLVLQWANPVTGAALQEPFTGSVSFQPLTATDTLPHSASTVLTGAAATPFTVHVCNNTGSPQAYFADPRTPVSQTLALPNQVSPSGSAVVTMPGAFALYLVPPDTTQLQASVTSTVPVTFDLSYLPGDPDISPAIPAPGVVESQSGTQAQLTFTAPEMSQGLWNFVPDEIGPYPTTGEPTASANLTLNAVTPSFDSTVSTSTGNAWQAFNNLTSTFNPLYLDVGECGDITGSVTPDAATGTTVSGTVNIDDFALGAFINSNTTFVPASIFPSGDQVFAIPFTYTVG